MENEWKYKEKKKVDLVQEPIPLRMHFQPWVRELRVANRK